MGLLQAGAFLTALMSLATHFNSLHRLLELFSHFRLQYFVTSLLLALLFLLLRERKWAGGMLLLTLINVAPIASWYLAETDSATAGAHSFVLMQANVLAENEQTELLLAEIAAEQPDIIFLQEVTTAWVAAMSPLQEAYPYSFAIPQDDNFGIAVYARQPLLDVEAIESPPHALPTLRVRQVIDGTSVTFVTTHPFPPLGSELTRARNIQLESIAVLMASIPGPKVLVGDLNITMWAQHYRELIDQTGLRNTRYGFGVIPTWPRHLPFAAIPIDHCLVSEEFTVLETRAGENTGSDHLPLLVKLGLRER